MVASNYFDTLNWIYLETYSEGDITVDAYMDESRTWLKQVWNDGYIEITQIDD